MCELACKIVHNNKKKKKGNYCSHKAGVMSMDNHSWQMFLKDQWLTAVLESACLLDPNNKD